jgi:hypothetical protein
MRVFACYVVSKLQRHRCPTFRDYSLHTYTRKRSSIFIYIDYNYLELKFIITYQVGYNNCYTIKGNLKQRYYIFLYIHSYYSVDFFRKNMNES